MLTEAKRLAEDVFEGYPCYVLELEPAETDSEYTSLEMWVWKEEFSLLRIELYKEEKTCQNSN